jgi:plasmid stabilization system protein ParE
MPAKKLTRTTKSPTKKKYTEKQKRKAEHIEEGYVKKGVSQNEAEKRAWATVNAIHGGGEKPGGGGYGKPENKGPYRKGARKAAAARAKRK